MGEPELHLVLVEEVLGHRALDRLPVVQLEGGVVVRNRDSYSQSNSQLVNQTVSCFDRVSLPYL